MFKRCIALTVILLASMACSPTADAFCGGYGPGYGGPCPYGKYTIRPVQIRQRYVVTTRGVKYGVPRVYPIGPSASPYGAARGGLGGYGYPGPYGGGYGAGYGNPLRSLNPFRY